MPQGRAGLSLSVPTEELTRATKAAEVALAAKQQELLEVIGEYLLGKVYADYETKSKGGTGEDGVTWEGLLPSSLRSRRRGKTQARRAKARERDKTSRSPSSGSREGSRKRVSPSSGNYRIGVNTGAQLRSLKSSKGGDASPSLVIANDSVTVQAGMSYSKYFVKDRPIVPEKLPERWTKELEDKATEFAKKVIGDAFNKR